MKTPGIFLNLERILYLSLFTSLLFSGCKAPEGDHIRIVQELNIGESQTVTLSNGDIVNIALLDIEVIHDSLRGAVRGAEVRVSVDGKEFTLHPGNYNLPVDIGIVQIDCPVIKAYYSGSRRDIWGLEKDARFRLWPKDSPYARPGTLVYPVKQAWFASRTQSGNELAGLGWAEDLTNTVNFYYHEAHDIGGAEGMDVIVSATDGLVVSSNKEVLEGYEDLPGDTRPDVVYVLDKRGWYIRYSHLNSIDPSVRIGEKIKMGQKIGYMGKEGGSGGWVHLHFGIHYKNPLTLKWEVEDAYAYLWEAYVNAYKPPVIAVARPRQILWTGQETILDGTKSKSFSGNIISYEWIFTDGTTAQGAIRKRRYEKAGEYSEILKVTDSKGNTGYDFTHIQVFDREFPGTQIPTIHACFHPSLGIKQGDPVTFLVRTFGSNTGDEIWDFGDGTEKVRVNSGVVNRKTQNEGKYAETVHSFTKPGQYIVKVERTNEHGLTAISHLHVVVN